MWISVPAQHSTVIDQIWGLVLTGLSGGWDKGYGKVGYYIGTSNVSAPYSIRYSGPQSALDQLCAEAQGRSLDGQQLQVDVECRVGRDLYASAWESVWEAVSVEMEGCTHWAHGWDLCVNVEEG